ncbi:MAG: radical SAM protein, partial [Planctomycetes bacterium]|nr:radical SAM protein [Planctomycetota bacterium]
CDCVIAANDRLLRAMKDSGCVGLILGLESPKPETLREAGKSFVSPDTYEWRIRKIQSYGINLWGAFIFGFDHDTWRDCRDACRFAQRMNFSMSCYPILTPYPGTHFFEQFKREGRIRTYDWERYNGASVVYEPKQMTPKQLRHAQMAAFGEFFSLGSAFRRLRLFPLKWRSWIANVAIWKGIRYYYTSRRRQLPAFRDFLDPSSKTWHYPDEQWEVARALAEGAAGFSPRGRDDRSRAACPPPLKTLTTSLIGNSNPLVQAAERLGEAQVKTRVSQAKT